MGCPGSLGLGYARVRGRVRVLRVRFRVSGIRGRNLSITAE